MQNIIVSIKQFKFSWRWRWVIIWVMRSGWYQTFKLSLLKEFANNAKYFLLSQSPDFVNHTCSNVSEFARHEVSFKLLFSISSHLYSFFVRRILFYLLDETWRSSYTYMVFEWVVFNVIASHPQIVTVWAMRR